MEDLRVTADELKTQVIKAEGFAEGFQAGYRACAEFVAKQLAAKHRGEENGTGIQAGNGNTQGA